MSPVSIWKTSGLVRAGVMLALALLALDLSHYVVRRPAAAAAACCAESAAQDEEKQLSSVEVRAVPRLATSGAPVTLTGRTAIDHDSRRVKITVTLPASGNPGEPGAATEELTAQVTPEGDFTARFGKTSAKGTYRVTVASPSGRDRGETTFQIMDPPQMQAEIANELREIGKTADQALSTAEELVASLPASPAKDEFIEKAKPLKEKLAQWPAQSEKFRTALQNLQKAGESSPGFGAIVYQDVFGPLGEWHGESRSERERISAELQRSKAAGVRCDALHKVAEALEFVSFLTNLGERKPSTILFNFAKDYDAKKISAVEPDPAKQLIISSTIKALPDLAAGWAGFAKLVLTLATDLTQFATNQVFAKYCEKFAGPIEASVHAEYLEGGQAWWKFQQDLRGRLTLRYAKPDAAGQAIKVTGEFVGNATRYAVEDNAIPVLFPKLARAAQFFKRLILPAVTAAGQDVRESQGSVASALGPTGFNIPVEGELIDKKLTLRVRPATTDLNNPTAKVIYVAVSVLALGPVNSHYEIGFLKAHHIITAAIGADAAEMDVVVDSKKKVMTINRAFQGERGSRTGKAHGVFTLKVNLKNPPG